MTSKPRAHRGVSLIELTIVCLIMGILASFGVPRFSRAMEQSRANIAVAKLQTICTAQRIYWFQNKDTNGNNIYAPDLQTLRDAKLIDQAIIDDPGGSTSAPGISYVFAISPGASTTFEATARRVNSTTWESSLKVDSDGNITGNVQYVGPSPAPSDLKPIDQFFQ